MLDSIQKKIFDQDDFGDLAVVICHFNPCGYRNPILNLKRMLEWLSEQHLPTYAAELRCGKSVGSSPVLLSEHPKVFQLQSDSVMFRKENLWNLTIARLPNSFRFILCLDADVILARKNWKAELLFRLKTHKIVHPFTHAVWMDSLRVPYKRKYSSLYAAAHGMENPESGKLYHPGFGLACHRDFWEHTKGLYNGPFGEGASCFMAAILGKQQSLFPYFKGLSSDLLHDFAQWAHSTHKWAQSSFCSLDGEALHFWHGSTKFRKYMWDSPVGNSAYLDRCRWFKDFNPFLDWTMNTTTGLVEWSRDAVSKKQPMIGHVEKYFIQRKEDEWFDSSKTA